MAVLTAALAVGSLPGLAGSREPSPDRAIDAALFRQVNLATTRDRLPEAAAEFDVSAVSAARLDEASRFVDPASDVGPAALAARVSPTVPRPVAGSDWKPPRYRMTGEASFYSNGTTAMRLPRGTVIVICGAAGCIQRVVNDYGPAKYTGRIVDMYKPDFFAICGCGWWSGTTKVTISIY